MPTATLTPTRIRAPTAIGGYDVDLLEEVFAQLTRLAAPGAPLEATIPLAAFDLAAAAVAHCAAAAGLEIVREHGDYVTVRTS